MSVHRFLTVGLLALPTAIVATPALTTPALAAPKAACGRVHSDFDGDGRADLAAGAPYDRTPGRDTWTGSVSIVYDPTGTATKQTINGADLVAPPVGEYSYFGYAVASGYLDGDCYADLVVGAPYTGSKIVVLYGSARGVTTDRARVFDRSAIPGGSTHDNFGAAVTTGDFNRDGFDDIAAGAPAQSRADAGAGDDDGPVGSDGGAVGILPGSAAGATTTGSRWIVEGADGVVDSPKPYDGLGYALAAGDFNGDGYADLAAGAVGEHGGEDYQTGGAGGVVVVDGGPTGLTGAGSVYLDQDTPGVPGTREKGDYFGAELAAGDVTGDGRADLVIGSPFETLGSGAQARRLAGSIAVVKGGPNGLTGTGAVAYDQDVAAIPGTAESNDWFGNALALTDLNGDGRLDLAVGSPGEALGTVDGAGSITVLYGTTGGLTTAGSRFVSQNSAGVPGANEPGDRFATTLAALPGALAAGAVGENTAAGSTDYIGAVTVLTGNLSAGRFFGPGQFPRVTTGDGLLGFSVS